jgi:hypothetical protein
MCNYALCIVLRVMETRYEMKEGSAQGNRGITLLLKTMTTGSSGSKHIAQFCTRDTVPDFRFQSFALEIHFLTSGSEYKPIHR